jgi:Asp-tRNA(Asn)/Glu-tRNA(Gln) amidotransferase A subunit family amidase
LLVWYGCSAADNSDVSAWGRCGYPIVSVPAGAARGLPFGCAFIGTAFSEATLLRLAYAYEQATRAIVRPEFRASLDEPTGPAAQRASL